MASYTEAPIRLPSLDVRALQLVFGGIDQAGPSFEGRVFLDRPGADATTPRTREAGYAGSFHVLGYGSAPPPAIAEALRAREGTEPVAPIEKRVQVDGEALRLALERAAELVVTVVVVPVVGGQEPPRPYGTLRVVVEPDRPELGEGHAPR